MIREMKKKNRLKKKKYMPIGKVNKYENKKRKTRKYF